MSYSKRTREKSIEPYIKLDYDMTESAAWTSLPFSAVWVYIELKKKFTYEHGHSRLILPYSAVDWKMSPSTFSKAIRELCNKGFIKYVEHGGLPRRPNVFALSEAWKSKSIEIVDTEGREAILLKRKNQKLIFSRNQFLEPTSNLPKDKTSALDIY